MTDPYIHLNIPKGHYIGQVRRYGHHYWTTVTGRCKKPENALTRAVQKMGERHNRARALFIDHSGWYSPTISLEANK